MFDLLEESSTRRLNDQRSAVPAPRIQRNLSASSNIDQRAPSLKGSISSSSFVDSGPKPVRTTTASNDEMVSFEEFLGKDPSAGKKKSEPQADKKKKSKTGLGKLFSTKEKWP